MAKKQKEVKEKITIRTYDARPLPKLTNGKCNYSSVGMERTSRCTQKATWQTPAATSSEGVIVGPFVWCEDHRLPEDVEIEER